MNNLSVDYSDLVSNPQNFVVGMINSVPKAEDILERCPRVLAYLQELILEIEDDIGKVKGKIVLKCKADKAAVIKATVETDVEYLTLRGNLRKTKAVQILWENVVAASKYKLNSFR